MKSVKITSDIFFMDWHLSRHEFTELQIDEQPFAGGGYGSVYNIRSNLQHKFSDKEVKWVLKITYTTDAVCKSGYRNIVELSKKIVDWQSKKFDDYELLFLKYEALIGFPQALFTGELDGMAVYGYIMPRLDSLNYTLFSDVEDNEELHGQYVDDVFNGNTLKSRFRAVYNLAKVFNLLDDQFGYLHGDIKSKSIWVNLTNYKTAIIDFDGGSFRPKGLGHIKNFLAANIMGELQPWLAPEIMERVNIEAGDAKFKVSWHSDYWAFTAGAFHIFMGIAPFSFLSETTFVSCKKYLKSNKWPELKHDQEHFKAQGEDAYEIEKDFRLLENFPAIWKLFETVFNKGFKSINQRKNYQIWEDVLLKELDVKKPEVNVDISPKVLLEGDSATLSWSIDRGFIYIDSNRYNKNGSRTCTLSNLPKIRVINEFGEWQIVAPVEIVKKPKIQSTQLSANAIPIGKQVVITWKQEFAEMIEVIVNASEPILVKGDSFTCTPNKSQDIEVRFHSKYDLIVVSKQLSIEVVEEVKIESFTIDREFIAETLPVRLSWNVNNADVLRITGIEKQLEKSGEVVMRPKKSGEIIISASNKFFAIEKSIYVEVFPIPKIENLSLPALPKLQVEMPNLIDSIPGIMNSLPDSKGIFNKIFEEHED